MVRHVAQGLGHQGSSSTGGVMRQLFVAIFLCPCFALTIAASDSTGKGKTESAGADTALPPSGYASRAGALLDTYRPPRSDQSPAHRVRAANRFLRSLNDGRRTIV